MIVIFFVIFNGNWFTEWKWLELKMNVCMVGYCNWIEMYGFERIKRWIMEIILKGCNFVR